MTSEANIVDTNGYGFLMTDKWRTDLSDYTEELIYNSDSL